MEKFETNHTPGPWHPIQYASYWELHIEPFYGEKSLLDASECAQAEHNAQLAAASPLLLSALINIFDFPIEYMNKWRKEDDYINISITKEKLDNALCAIEAALNINPEKIEK